MSETPRPGPDPLRVQLRAVPVLNRDVVVTPLDGGRLKLSVPRTYRWWERPVKWLLVLSDVKHLELDPLGAAVFSLLDGRHTLEEIIDAHSERWKLSFFESRGLVLSFLERLMKWNVVLVRIPEAEG
jgi:hypothetical protein